ncbi:CU044_2847 family protein [Streptomyces sp. NBRC 109706]|uniref:CU044_2847 family protein n=1 Tax=Streptomyces sp. NBRC 109706 TaxID=1550035 RepID=UPI0007851EE9|nr:CU044_2847 family protein [Streptomyces sp. NBRC 109706]
MSSEVTRVSLPDGTPVWARISDAEQAQVPEQQPRSGYSGSGGSSPGGSSPGNSGSSYSDTGIAQRAVAQLESFRDLISGVAASVADGVRDARPDEVSVSFGIELTAKAGKVVGLLAEGEAKGAITVTLTWQGPPVAGPSRDAT